MHLAIEHGAANVTVEAICARAEVSERTFFNYFPFKEAAFAIAPPPFSEEAVSAFLHSPGPLHEALIELIVSRMSTLQGDTRVLRVLREIASHNPRVLAIQISKTHAADAELAKLIARRQCMEADDPASLVLASALTAAAHTVLDAWAEQAGADAATMLRVNLRSLKMLAQDAPNRPSVLSRL